MDTLYLVLDTLAITLLLLIACSFVASGPKTKAAWLIGLIAFNYICYLISARQDYADFIPNSSQLDFGSVYILLNLARNSISAVFMLLAHALFREDRRLPRTLIALIGVQLFLEEPLGWIIGSQWEDSNPQLKWMLYELLPTFFQMTFTSFALYWAINERNVDLVENRREIRIVVLILITVHGLLTLVVERITFTSGIVHPAIMYPIHMLLVLIQVVISGALVFWLLRRDLLDFIISKPSVTALADSNFDTTSTDVRRIREALEQDRIYHQMGLTVRDLANYLAIPEYRLRALILNHMGYRNFNSLLHHYRIEEVSAALEDPARNNIPVLTLALTAGYQSITPFNRAFRELKGMTPTQYRARGRNDDERFS